MEESRGFQRVLPRMVLHQGAMVVRLGGGGGGCLVLQAPLLAQAEELWHDR